MKNSIRSYRSLQEKILTDTTFREEFIINPKPFLAEVGVSIPDSVEMRIHIDSNEVKNYVLPLQSSYQKVDYSKFNSVIFQVIELALENADFKHQLIKNPHKAIQEVTGKEVSESLTIHFHEDTDSLKHLVLRLDNSVEIPSHEELNDKELEMVAGGTLAGGIMIIPQTIGLFLHDL